MTGETRGPGWCIVRSIVRLLYLVPSFCGSLSHPPPPLSLSLLYLPSFGAHLRVRSRTVLSLLFLFLFSLLVSPSFPYLTAFPCPSHHLPSLFSSLFIFHLSPLYTYPLLFWARSHCQPPSTTAAASGAVTSSSQPPRAASLRAEERDREHRREREKEEEGSTHAHACACGRAVIYTRGPQIRPVDRGGFVGGASDN